MCCQLLARQGKQAAVGDHVGTMWRAAPTLLRPSALWLVDLVWRGLHVSQYELHLTGRCACAADELVDVSRAVRLIQQLLHLLAHNVCCTLKSKLQSKLANKCAVLFIDHSKAHGQRLPVLQVLQCHYGRCPRKKKEGKDYKFQRQFNQKPSIMPGCPRAVHSICLTLPFSKLLQ